MKLMKRKAKLKIGERDLKLFRYLFVSQVANYKQISRDVFPGRLLYLIARRNSQLTKAGYLKKQNCYDGYWNCVTYSITAKTLKEFLPEINRSLTSKQTLSGNISHDLTLVEIRNILKKSAQVSSYQTENGLRTDSIVDHNLPIKTLRRLRSDAGLFLKLKKGNYPVALEYEASFKDSARYNKKLMDYYDRKEIEGVLYIFKKDSDLQRVLKLEKKHCNLYAAKFFYCLLEDLLKAKEKITFTNRAGKSICINLNFCNENQTKQTVETQTKQEFRIQNHQR